MQVLGDSVKLPERSGLLPLPWYHRAPLGLQTRTQCYAAIIESEARPVGDLIVSVLDPVKWEETIRVECARDDEPGVMADAIKSVTDLNIELAEGITTEAGTFHEVTLVCQPTEDTRPPSPTKVKKRLRDSRFENPKIEMFSHRTIRWIRTDDVSHGWLRRTQWRKEIVKLYGHSANFDKVDLTRAVVSADTRSRLPLCIKMIETTTSSFITVEGEEVKGWQAVRIQMVARKSRRRPNVVDLMQLSSCAS